jgi:hypothetical protein
VNIFGAGVQEFRSDSQKKIASKVKRASEKFPPLKNGR